MSNCTKYMELFYVGLAQGKVAHILKPDSYVENRGYADYELTICGRRISEPWFAMGIDPYGAKKPDYIPLCKKCENIIRKKYGKMD